jgi:hypothetical protein
MERCAADAQLKKNSIGSIPKVVSTFGSDALEAVMNLKQLCGMLEPAEGEDDDVEASKGGVEALIILDEPAAAGGPGARLLDDPVVGEEHEVAFGVR